MNTRPKIALMSYTMDNRLAKGTALYARRLVEELLKDKNFEFYLVHFDKVDDPIYKRANEIVMPKLKLPFATRFIRTLLFFWKYRNNKFDIIHWFQPRLYPFFWFAPAKKIVVTAHGAGDITAPSFFVFSKSVFNFLMVHFNKYVDATIAVSNFAKDEIIKYYKITPKNVFVIYNGGGENYQKLDKSDSQVLIAGKYNVKYPYILDISRLEPHKNVFNLIQGYIIAREKYNFDHKLVIVGNKGFGHQPTLDLAKKSKYKDDIYFIDYVEPEDLNAVYSGADAFVFPSLNEGFGLPLVEAMASGTPVITSNITSMPEIICSAGLTVNPLDPEDIAMKIKELFSKPDLRLKFINDGIIRSQAFTWKITGEETKKIYNLLLI